MNLEKKLVKHEKEEYDTDYLSYVKHKLEQFSKGSTFNRNVGKCTAISASRKKFIAELFVESEHANEHGTLHGGQTAALVDILTSTHLNSVVRNWSFVTVDLSVSYFLPVKIGETIKIQTKLLKLGRRLIFMEAKFRRKSDDVVTTRGKHILSFISPING